MVIGNVEVIFGDVVMIVSKIVYNLVIDKIIIMGLIMVIDGGEVEIFVEFVELDFMF